MKLYTFKQFITLFIIIYLFLLIGFWLYDSYQIKLIYQNRQIPVYKEINQTLYNPPNNINDLTYSFKDAPYLEIDLNEYLNLNNDVVGYLLVSGTKVNYPIVQTSDNNFYLNHDLNKNINKAGAIFSDYRNNLNDLNKNSIIYGHRRLDDSMFTSLKLLLDENWFTDNFHYLIYLNTLKYKMIFQIFSVYTIPSENDYLKTHFINNEFIDFIKKMQERSLFNFNTEINENDKILTLSTCLDSLGLNRIVIHSKLIKKESIKLSS